MEMVVLEKKKKRERMQLRRKTPTKGSGRTARGRVVREQQPRSLGSTSLAAGPERGLDR